MVARRVRDHKVVGSNPVASTIKKRVAYATLFFISWLGDTRFVGRQEKRSFSQVGGFYRRLDSN